jgi:DNA repair exonuclease SbcCD ATPase subunit
MICNIKDIVDFYNEYPEYIGKIQVETQYGYKDIEFADVTALNSEIIKIELEDNFFIEGSPDHQIYSQKNNWQKLKKIILNEKILTKNGYKKVISIEKLPQKEDLYDLQVAEKHEFYANNIVSHNSSLISDTLCFCLFGKPYRKIKINELINRKNKKKLYTECTFQIGTHEYKVIRTLAPNSLSIQKDGQEIEQLSSKGLTQDEIDKILGVNYDLFKQIISMSMNYNRPFLSLYAFDKRTIIESIFNIKIFSEMLKILKKDLVNLKMHCDIDRKTLSVMENNIKSLLKRKKELSIALKDFEVNKQNDINKIQTTIQNRVDEYNNLLKQLNELHSSLVEIEDEKPLKETVKNLHKLVNVDQFKISQLNEKQKLLNSNTSCPTCNSEITEEHKNIELSNIFQQLEQLNTVVNFNNSEIIKIEKNIKNITSERQQATETQNQIFQLKQRIKWIEEELVSLEAQYQNTTNRSIDFNIESLITEITEKSNEYADLYEKFQCNTESSQLYESVASILSDNGIKSHFYKKLMPILNSKINQYLNRFEIPIQITINELMEEKIVNLENITQNISYLSHSEGEKKRIDLAILLSFISMAKNISNWECNIIMFDELLDSAMDEDGLDNVINCLKSIQTENKNLCVYVISHRLIESDHFNNHIKVFKHNGFSEIEK